MFSMVYLLCLVCVICFFMDYNSGWIQNVICWRGGDSVSKGIWGWKKLIWAPSCTLDPCLKPLFASCWNSCCVSVSVLFAWSGLPYSRWLSTGNVWIYGAYGDVDTEDSLSPKYCHPTCYWFAFWLTTSVYILTIIMFCCLACLGLCAAFWPHTRPAPSIDVQTVA